MVASLTSWRWVAGFYVGHLRVYAWDEEPKPAWSTREGLSRL